MTQTIPASLPFLRSHSIFIPSSSSTSTSQDDDWELVEKQSDDLVGQKYSRMVMRDKDLLIAMGREVRMLSLAGGDGWEVENGKVGTYKVCCQSLHSSDIYLDLQADHDNRRSNQQA